LSYWPKVCFNYLASRCNVRFFSAGQNFFISRRFVIVRLFRVVV